MQLGHRIRAARTAAGLTQIELARRMGTGQAEVSKIENGRHLPQLSTMGRLLRALDIRLTELDMIGTKTPRVRGRKPSKRYGHE